MQKEWELDCRTAHTHEPKTHGRCETRTIRTSTWSVDRIQALGWPEVQQIFELERIRQVKGQKSTREVIYGITSLSREEASPERLLALCRGHWSIENELHYVRDVTLCEDQCRVRKGSSPRILASLRNLVVHILTQQVRTEEHRTRADAIRQNELRPRSALQKLIAL